MACFPDDADDVYIPSIPEMPAALHTTPAMVNLTLSGFIFFDAVGMLIFGAVSDKLGRKVPLVMSLKGLGTVARNKGFTLFLIVATSFSVVAGMIRPYVVGVMLDQQEGDTGSASSLINFSQMGIGAVGMELEMLPWRSYITGIGVLALASMGLAIIVWVALLHSRITVVGVHEPEA